MSAALDLVVLNGPLEGDVVRLSPKAPLKVGRSVAGLQLIDPLVSLNHARISWEGDRYWIEDLDSATGTFVNDVRLTEKSVVLVPGMRIRLGETEIEVRERPRSHVLRIVGVLAVLFVLFLAVRSFMESIEVEYDAKLAWFEEIQQGAGYTSQVLQIPEEFIRETGVDHRGLTMEKVTDYDANGVDEIWLSWNGGRRVITFNPDGSWRTIADIRPDCEEDASVPTDGIPAECRLRPGQVATDLPAQCAGYVGKGTFPDLDCAGTIYRYADGGYRVVDHDGVYAWMPPTKPGKAPAPKKDAKGPPPKATAIPVEGPAEPYVFTLVNPSTLAGFLSERGVVEPIHYLICEQAVPGARAQVLTERGELVPLAIGCIRDIKVDGPTTQETFGPTRPRMLAFTGTGYEALVQDVTRHLAGMDDPSLMTREQRIAWQKLQAPPLRRTGAVRVSFKGPARIFDPVAYERPLKGERRLEPTEFASSRPPAGEVLTITGPGRYPGLGCNEFEVRMNDWHCLFTKGCTATTEFLTVQNVGCGANERPVSVPYAAGAHPYVDSRLVGRALVESIDDDGQIDVLRIRLAYRPRE